MMKKTSVVIVVSLVTLLCCCLPAAYAAGTTADDRCLYIISVQTGNVANAGTDAKISVTFKTADGAHQLYIGNLESWNHDHPDPFEKGRLDTFQGYDKCKPDFCQMRLQSDNSGSKSGWYVDYVHVQAITIRDGSDHYWQAAAPGMFQVSQWLALDEPPYQLYAHKDICAGTGTGAEVGAAVL